MASSKSMKKVILKFASSSSSKGQVKQATVEWSTKKTTISHLCVTVCTISTGELVHLFVNLQLDVPEFQFPLLLDTSSGTVRLVVYGLSLKDESVMSCFSIKLSGQKQLTAAAIDKAKGSVCVALSNRHVVQLAASALPEKVTKFPIGIKQEPPSWYYVSNLPTLSQLGSASQNHFLLVLQQEEPFEELLVLKTTLADKFCIPVELSSLTNFKAKVHMLHQALTTPDFSLFSVKMASSDACFMTYLSASEIQLLFARAMQLVSSKKKKTKACHQISHFYRNKPPDYFNNIFTKCGGVMQKYCKDYNGDRGSSINGNLDGLFFATAHDPKTNRPPNFSFYGKRRLHIPSNIIFHDQTNLYFADFYCHYEAHYVTLVLTEIGSMSDIFCRSRLLPLDPLSNPFLYKSPPLLPLSPMRVHASSRVHVEVFYTEDIDIRALMARFSQEVFFTDVRIMGAGKSKPAGIPKNANCQICNLK